MPPDLFRKEFLWLALGVAFLTLLFLRSCPASPPPPVQKRSARLPVLIFQLTSTQGLGIISALREKAPVPSPWAVRFPRHNAKLPPT